MFFRCFVQKRMTNLRQLRTSANDFRNSPLVCYREFFDKVWIVFPPNAGWAGKMNTNQSFGCYLQKTSPSKFGIILKTFPPNMLVANPQNLGWPRRTQIHPTFEGETWSGSPPNLGCTGMNIPPTNLVWNDQMVGWEVEIHPPQGVWVGNFPPKIWESGGEVIYCPPRIWRSGGEVFFYCPPSIWGGINTYEQVL